MKKRIIILTAMIMLVGLVGFSFADNALDLKRLSEAERAATSFFGFYADYLKEKALFLGLIWLVCVLLTAAVVTFVLASLNRLSEGGTSYKYKELAPVVERLDYLEKVSGNSDNLLNRLDMGVLIMSSAADVVLINRFAAALLGYRGEGKLAFFIRDEGLYNIVKSGQNARVFRTEQGRVFSFSFEFGRGITIIITDVSVQRKAEDDRNRLLSALNEVVAPLATISGYAELIRGGMKEQNVRDAAGIISDEVRRISAAAKRTLSE